MEISWDNLTTSTSVTSPNAAPDLSQFWLHKQHMEGRICAFEFDGKPNYYACRRHEYCCGVGCCVSPAFAFYQLWYFWLMIILLFLLCSGGGWWYRSYYWPRLAPSPPPSMEQMVRSRRRHYQQHHLHHPGGAVGNRPAASTTRVTQAFGPAAFRNDQQLYIHAAGWKAYGPSQVDPENPPPPYSAVSETQYAPSNGTRGLRQSATAASTSTHRQDDPCPPPPSYDFVMRQNSQQREGNNEAPAAATAASAVTSNGEAAGGTGISTVSGAAALNTTTTTTVVIGPVDSCDRQDAAPITRSERA